MPPQPGSAGMRGCKNICREYHQAVKGRALCKNERARGLIYTARQKGKGQGYDCPRYGENT